ncbi:hypothetical protein O3Q51_12305 [Cryomorphaceae bacterium 1068]|nr:hypothetical protein [Cryomorphaceae bacterium 1068]
MTQTSTASKTAIQTSISSAQAFINTLVAVSFSDGDVSALALALINQKLACKDFLLDQNLPYGLRKAVDLSKELGPEGAILASATSVSKDVTLCCFANAVHLSFLITGIDSEKGKLINCLMEAWTIDYESYRMILETIKLMDGKDFKIAIKF